MNSIMRDVLSFSLVLGVMGAFYPIFRAAFFDPNGRMFPRYWEDVPVNLWIAVVCALQMPIVLIVAVIVKVNSQ